MSKMRHTGIVVTDMERSIDFYNKYLDFKVKKDMDESGDYIDQFLALKDVKVRTVKMASEDDSLIELLYFYSHPEENAEKKINQIGCSHIALTIVGIDELYSLMSDEGVDFNGKPRTSPDGAARVAFCKDPDGTFIELVEELN
jgi:catechol 2,3-dioxygenase-like lactoylglutathione lyase family enzyme|tara:strand:+ start:385 stop:813 length:429 start_codon:yes stop_codon:yes gene_type:complete